MTDSSIKMLTNQVQTFLKRQAGYEKYSTQHIDIFDDGGGVTGIVFGKDLQAGIAGFGKSVDEAYSDFVRNWQKWKGFEWIEKHL